MLSDTILEFIERQHLLRHDGRYLVALSGGADSVAMMCVLLDLGYNIEAVHCNFHLRGKESDRDQDFCQRLCDARNVSLHIVHFDTTVYADIHKISIEMAARELRYGYFETLRHDMDFAGICVAHHKDDSVETVILNLIRGTGINGLKGIAPRSGYVLRPMLCVSRTDIERYLDYIKQEYIIDSSNKIADVKRNKIRLKVIPLLKDIDVAAADNIYNTSLFVDNIIPIVDSALQESSERVTKDDTSSMKIDVSALKSEKSPETVLWHILKSKGFSSAQVMQIYANIDAQTGRIYSSPTHELLFDRGQIFVEPISKDVFSEKIIPEAGIYVIADNLRMKVSSSIIDDSFIIDRVPTTATLDAGKVRFPLTVRTVHTGDWFMPFGMKGRKLISDFLTDLKLSVFDKRRQLVVTDASGEILWVVGRRTDNRRRILPSSTDAIVLSIY